MTDCTCQACGWSYVGQDDIPDDILRPIGNRPSATRSAASP
jgi:hypothetical protein